MCGVSVYMILWKWLLPPSKPSPFTPTSSSQGGGSLTRHHYFLSLTLRGNPWKTGKILLGPLIMPFIALYNLAPAYPSDMSCLFPWLTLLATEAFHLGRRPLHLLFPLPQTFVSQIFAYLTSSLYSQSSSDTLSPEGLLSPFNLNKLPIHSLAYSIALQCVICFIAQSIL